MTAPRRLHGWRLPGGDNVVIVVDRSFSLKMIPVKFHHREDE
jgi:hypothetical protein